MIRYLAEPDTGAQGLALATSEQWERPALLGALALGIFWAIETVDYARAQPWIVGLLLVGGLCAWSVASGARFAAWATLAYAVAVGYADRVVRKPFVGSDVLTATREAIAVVGRGIYPYAHTYLTTNPPRSPFPYLPGEIAFYAIPQRLFGTLQSADTWAGVGVVFLLAALAPVVGPSRAAFATTLYATFGLAAYRATDGSNDTGLAFLMTLAIVLLAWSEHVGRLSNQPGWARSLFYASAIVFAWALLFKHFAWLIYPFVLLSLRKRREDWRVHASISVGLAGLMILPFVLTAPTGFWRNVVGGLTYHQEVWGLNLWAGLQTLAPSLVGPLRPLIPSLGLAALALVGLLLIAHPVEDLGLAILQGLGLLFVALVLARWTTSPYYTFAAAILAVAIALVSPARTSLPAPNSTRQPADDELT